MHIFAETNRLILRELLPSDVEAMFELDSDPEVHRYLGNQPLTDKAQSANIIEFVRQQYTENGIGRWAIIQKSSNEFVGWAGLKFVTQMTNGNQNYYDIGYRLIRRFWGQGIATESAIASLEYGFNVLKIETIYAAAHQHNLASNKILQKIGMTQNGSFDYDGELCNWYEIHSQRTPF